MIFGLSKLYLRFRKFILLVQTKKYFLWTMAALQAAENHINIIDTNINFSLKSLTKFTSSSRGTEFKDILPWNFSQTITEPIPISKIIVISYTMKQGILFWAYWNVNGNWDNNLIRIFQWRESHCNRVHQVYQFHQNELVSPYDGR